jgi:hypothetical protein
MSCSSGTVLEGYVWIRILYTSLEGQFTGFKDVLFYRYCPEGLSLYKNTLHWRASQQSTKMSCMFYKSFPGG